MNTITLLQGEAYTESGAIWSDVVDGSGILSTPFSGSVDTSTLGTYTLLYQYVDSSNNTGTTTRTVHVLPVPDTTPPVVTLSGSATLNLEAGSGYTDDGAFWRDNTDGSGNTLDTTFTLSGLTHLTSHLM